MQRYRQKKSYTLYFWWHYQYKNFDPNKTEIDETSNKIILIYYFGYVKIKDLKYVKINSVNPLHLFIGKMNGYFDEINGNKYLMLVPTNES